MFIGLQIRRKNRPSGIAKEVFDFYENRSKVKTGTLKLISAIKEDLLAGVILQTDIREGNPGGVNILLESWSEENCKKTGIVDQIRGKESI